MSIRVQYVFFVFSVERVFGCESMDYFLDFFGPKSPISEPTRPNGPRNRYCPHQNHYVPRHTSNRYRYRYINSYCVFLRSKGRLDGRAFTTFFLCFPKGNLFDADHVCCVQGMVARSAPLVSTRGAAARRSATSVRPTAGPHTAAQ